MTGCCSRQSTSFRASSLTPGKTGAGKLIGTSKSKSMTCSNGGYHQWLSDISRPVSCSTCPSSFSVTSQTRTPRETPFSSPRSLSTTRVRCALVSSPGPASFPFSRRFGCAASGAGDVAWLTEVTEFFGEFCAATSVDWLHQSRAIDVALAPCLAHMTGRH